VDYIAVHSPLSAKRVAKRIEKKAETLEFFPARGRWVPELKDFGIFIYRELIEKPWRIIYRIEKRTVYVTALLDGRRDLETVLLERLLR